jgi:hypothetical protein
VFDGEDWIGAFYGDVCIGSRVWNASYTDIPVMGFDADSPETQGYIVPGEYPYFVVYDASENIYYDAFTNGNHVFEASMLEMYIVNNIGVKRDCDGELGASEGAPYFDDCEVCVDEETGHIYNSDMDCAEVCFGSAYVDNCGACDDNAFNDCLTLSIDLYSGPNLISFNALPDDSSLASIFSSLGDNIKFIITEGSGAVNLGGIWYGSLYEITPDDGYWVLMNTDETLILKIISLKTAWNRFGYYQSFICIHKYPITIIGCYFI